MAPIECAIYRQRLATSEQNYRKMLARQEAAIDSLMESMHSQVSGHDVLQGY